MRKLLTSFREVYCPRSLISPDQDHDNYTWPVSAGGRWLRPHMMGRLMARLEAQHRRMITLAGVVLCRCWLYRMGEVTAKNLSRLMATRWNIEEVEQMTSLAR